MKVIIESKFLNYKQYRLMMAKRYLRFFLLVSPALLLRFSTTIYPLLRTMYFSLFEFNLISHINQFIGLQNFIVVLKDAETRRIIYFTMVYIFASTALQLILGLAVASLLNANFKGRQLARTIILIPWAIPMVVAALAFRWLLDDQYGMITDFVWRLVRSRPAWLVAPTSARVSVIMVNVWKNMPFMALVLLAGLQGVPEELYEAAKIDGASKFKSFWHITVPLSIPTIISIALFFVIWQLGNFDLIYGMTFGGPGVATTLIGYRIFQKGMLWYDWGMASALSTILILFVAIIGLAGLYLFKRYEVPL